jgi:hypothetical protein
VPSLVRTGGGADGPRAGLFYLECVRIIRCDSFSEIPGPSGRADGEDCEATSRYEKEEKTFWRRYLEAHLGPGPIYSLQEMTPSSHELHGRPPRCQTLAVQGSSRK